VNERLPLGRGDWGLASLDPSHPSLYLFVRGGVSKRMATWQFYLVLNQPEVTDADCDAIYATGCDDGTVVTREGITYIAFDRDAASLEEAVSSAVAQLLNAGCVVARAEVDNGEGAEESRRVLWSAEDMIQEDLAEYFCHFVALSGCYYPIDPSGDATGHARAFHYSGFILEVKRQWYWITAAHVFDHEENGLDTLRRSRRIHIEDCVLSDSFAGGGNTWMPIPFAYWDYDRIGCYDEAQGMDLCALKLSGNHRQLLEANGVVALSGVSWQPQDLARFDAFLALGLPTELEETDVTPESGGDRVRSKPMAAAVYVKRVEEVPAECLKPTPRFIGRVEKKAGNMQGMSGGPILGKSCDDPKHYLVAVQSSWIRTRGLIFGCPAETLANTILEESRS